MQSSVFPKERSRNIGAKPWDLLVYHSQRSLIKRGTGVVVSVGVLKGTRKVIRILNFAKYIQTYRPL